MGYYDAIENAWFKKREDGKYIFYPYGSFGHGYVMTETEAEEMKGFIGAYYAVGLLIAIAGIITFKLLPIVISAEVLVYYIYTRKRLRGKERSFEKMRSSEAMANTASRMSLWTLITFMLSEIVMFGFMIFMIIVVFKSMAEKLSMALFAIFLIFCFWGSVKMIRYKIKDKKGMVQKSACR